MQGTNLKADRELINLWNTYITSYKTAALQWRLIRLSEHVGLSLEHYKECNKKKVEELSELIDRNCKETQQEGLEMFLHLKSSYRYFAVPAKLLEISVTDFQKLEYIKALKKYLKSCIYELERDKNKPPVPLPELEDLKKLKEKVFTKIDTREKVIRSYSKNIRVRYGNKNWELWKAMIPEYLRGSYSVTGKEPRLPYIEREVPSPRKAYNTHLKTKHSWLTKG